MGNSYKREIVLLYLIMGYGNYYSTVRIGNKVVMDAIKVTGIIKEWWKWAGEYSSCAHFGIF